MIDTIVDYIRTNRISSVEVADALGKTGVIPDISPLSKGKYVVGKVFYVPCWGQSNWSLHDQIQSAPRDSVVFVDAYNCDGRALLGDLVAKQLFVYTQISGLVVNGYVRDANRLLKEDYPIWCKGVTPLGCHNLNVSCDDITRNQIEISRNMYLDSIMVADDSGCTLIKNVNLSAAMLSALEKIEIQEDIWYFCLDTLKMTTYEIVCLKRYQEKSDLLPPHFSEKLQTLTHDDND